MDKLEKFLSILSKKQEEVMRQIMKDVMVLSLQGYDIKKIVGQKNCYRLRKGKIRIIFIKYEGKGIIIDMDYRGGVYK